MGEKNIEYKSKQILEYYRSNRRTWDEFYPSERWVFQKIADEKGLLGDVLDVGCACGGLGAALSCKFPLNSYTGIDINKDAIDWASRETRLQIPTRFTAGDIVCCASKEEYDVVASLSCVDWNIKTKDIISACWERVRPGGYFVSSLRLTSEKGVNNIKKSFQYVNFSGEEEDPEVANYVVFNVKEAMSALSELDPAPTLIGAYGYWGSPSPTAVTLYDKLIFSVFYIKKGTEKPYPHEMAAELRLPLEAFL